MGCLNLDFSAGYSNDTVLGRFDTLTDLLALTHIDLHGPYLHATPSPAAHNPEPGFCGFGIPIGLHGVITFDGDSLVG
jgi:hypothetical protein